MALWANSPSRSLPPDGESSLISLLLLSPRDPLRWARVGAPSARGRPKAGRTHRCATRITNALHGAYSVGPDDPAGRGASRRRRPYGKTGAISPPVSLRSTAPSSEGAKEKSLPLTREVAFAKQMTEGETGRPHGAAPSSSQAPYRSLPPGGESSLTPLLQLSPPNPRLLPLGFGGGPKLSLFCRSVVIRRGAQCAPGPLVKGGCRRRKAVTGGFR